MKKYIYTIIAVLFSTGIFAQNFMDALRYSNHKLNGTARSAAMGNAFGALGGDFTSLSINPAGLGVYRTGEFVLSFDVSNINIDGTYQSNTSSDSKYNFGLNNLGYVATMKPQTATESGLVSFSLGIGYNKLNNFHQNALVESYGSPQSMLDYIVDKSNGIFVEDLYNENNPYYYVDLWDTKMAWETYLLDAVEGTDDEYKIRGLYNGDIVDQRRTISRKGGINEFVFSAGANFNHRFYLGATIGVHDVFYEESFVHTEFNVTPGFDANEFYIEDFSYYSGYETSGTGVNVKLGAIFKPVDKLRLGLAVHTPTFYSLRDTYSNMISSNNEQDYYKEASPEGDYEYDLETPLKAVFSAAYVIGKKALVSVDYEYVDYSKAKLKNGGTVGYGFTDENRDIKNIYKSVGNLRIGAEYRLNKITSLRAGYENYPSAFNSTFNGVNQPNSDAKYSAVSAGFGLKYKNFFVDTAYKHIMSEAYETLYGGSEMAKYEVGNDKLTFTLGFKF